MSYLKPILVFSIIILNNLSFAQNYKKPDFFALATVDSIYDGNIDTTSFLKQKKLLILSDKKLKIHSFKMQTICNGAVKKFESNSEFFTNEMITCFPKRKFFHNEIVIDDITAVSKRDTFLLNPIVLRIADKKDIVRKSVFLNIHYSSLDKKYNHGIPKKYIMEQKSLDSIPNYQIIEYATIPFYVKCDYLDYKNINRNLSDESKNIIKQISIGQKVVFRNIIAITNSKDTVLLTPIVLKIECCAY